MRNCVFQQILQNRRFLSQIHRIGVFSVDDLLANTQAPRSTQIEECRSTTLTNSTLTSLENRKGARFLAQYSRTSLHIERGRKRQESCSPRNPPSPPSSPSKYIAMMLTRTQSEQHIQCYRKGGKTVQCNGCSLNLGSSTPSFLCQNYLAHTKVQNCPGCQLSIVNL